MKQKKEKLDTKETWKNLKQSWKYIKCQKKYLIGYLLGTILLGIISMVSPILSAQMVLQIGGGIGTQILRIGLALFILEVSKNIVEYFSAHMWNLLFIKILFNVQVDLAKEMLKLETKEMDHNSSGVFIDRLNKDAREIAIAFYDINKTVIDMIANCGILYAVYMINKEILLYFVITMIILFFIRKKQMERYYMIDAEYLKISEKNTGIISELVRGIRDIKVLNISSSFVEKLKYQFHLSNNQQYKMEKVERDYSFLVSTVRDLMDFGFLIVGIYLLNKNAITGPSLLIIYYYSPRLFNFFRHFTNLIERLKKFNLSATRIFEILGDDTFEKETFGTRKLEKVEGNFEFKNVSFSYNGVNPVLKNMSFQIKANETVSFVGESGGGKSTIFSLLNRLYKIEKGDILIDGVSIHELSRDSIRNNMSIITQNPYIFNFSIRENLKIVKDDMTEEEMVEACKMACLHEFILTLPDGYDTVVGEGGLILSGGQRQRLAIARALLKKTEIILFDEATSALDNQTQKEISNAIQNMKGEYTILIIAHRLSTVIDSDRILLVSDGKIEAEGTHHELLETNQTYQKLYQSELEG